MEKIISKVKNDIQWILGNLQQYRLGKKNKEYKADTDSLEMLIDILYRKCHYNGILEIEFLQKLRNNLSDEIDLLSNYMDDLKKLRDSRVYRDWLIAYKKLTNLYERIDNDLEREKTKHIETRYTYAPCPLK